MMELRRNDTAIADQRRTFNFQNLPPEIRFLIWNLTVEPRMVYIRQRYPEITTKFMPLNLLCVTALPVALRVNQESRHELLKQYPLLFNDRACCQIRFNSTIDTLSLDQILSFISTYSGDYREVWDNISAKVKILTIDFGLL